MESRIAELEIKLSHCEDSIDELNRTVFRQQQQMELLQAQLRELYRLAQSDGTMEHGVPRDEIPPHY
jgi:SlyX protein